MPRPVPSHAGPSFFPLGTLSKIRAPLWLLFHPSVCWLTQAIILTSGPHPNSLRHSMALILPLEASPPELCASALCSYWAFFGSFSRFPFFFFFFSPWPHALFFHSHLLWVIWCSHWYMQGVVTKPNVTQIKNYISGECPPSFPLFLLSLLMSR